MYMFILFLLSREYHYAPLYYQAHIFGRHAEAGTGLGYSPMNGAMAIPNLIALLALSGVIVAETRDFKKLREREKGGAQGLNM